MAEEIEDEEIYDLSKEVVLADLDDEGLLFRESIIKTFYETANRTSKPVYGFTKDQLQEMANLIVEEFRSRGRDYKVPLDRSGGECGIERSHVKDEVIKTKGKTKDFFRFVGDMEVRLRDFEFSTAMCEYCTYFYNMRCGVLEHIVTPTQVCDAYSGGYFMDDSGRKYIIEDLGGFISGLMQTQPLQKILVRMLDAPVGMLLIFKDGMASPHYFSVTMNEFIEDTVSKHHWTQNEVNKLSGLGGIGNE